jgi:hypothetical protein
MRRSAWIRAERREWAPEEFGERQVGTAARDVKGETTREERPEALLRSLAEVVREGRKEERGRDSVHAESYVQQQNLDRNIETVQEKVSEERLVGLPSADAISEGVHPRYLFDLRLKRAWFT